VPPFLASPGFPADRARRDRSEQADKWVPACAGTTGKTAPMYYVYLLASKLYGTLYIGVTSDIA
jgi:hypothetical protein